MTMKNFTFRITASCWRASSRPNRYCFTNKWIYSCPDIMWFSW